MPQTLQPRRLRKQNTVVQGGPQKLIILWQNRVKSKYLTFYLRVKVLQRSVYIKPENWIEDQKQKMLDCSKEKNVQFNPAHTLR